MQAELNNLLAGLKTGEKKFSDVISFIESHYIHTATAFSNGSVSNASTQNQGSAKVFSFAKINDLNEQDTLWLFAEHYQSVLETPTQDDHQNIRQFMQNGWAGIAFEGEALTAI